MMVGEGIEVVRTPYLREDQWHWFDGKIHTGSYWFIIERLELELRRSEILLVFTGPGTEHLAERAE